MLRQYRLPILILILLLAYAGRLIHIDQESLWVDEGFSYWAIRHDDMWGLLKRDVHPPLYFYMLRGWAQIAGITELALRYLSVLPSILSVAVVFNIARELEYSLVGTRRAVSLPAVRDRLHESMIPVLAALMMALADMENYVAQETRMYTWHVLWAAVSMWLFLRWVRASKVNDETQRFKGTQAQIGTRRTVSRPWCPGGVWVISALLLLYTHYIGVCTVIVLGIYALLFLRGHQRAQALRAFGLISVLFVPWLAVVVQGQTANIGTGFNVPSTLESLWNYRINWFTQQWALMIGLALVGLVAVTYGGIQSGHPNNQMSPAHREQKRWTIDRFAPAFLMLAWFVIPVALTYSLNFYVPIFIDYRLTQITPAAALMVAFGLGAFRPPALSFLVAVIVIYGVAADDASVKRPPWREVGQNAARYALPGDLAMAHITPSGDWQVMYYYERFMPEGVERRSLRQWQVEHGDTYAGGLPALLALYPHVWFMHWSKDLSGFEALAQTGHIQTAVMTEDWLGNDLNVYRFDIVPPVGAQIVTFTSGMILRDAAVINNPLRIDLWWSADALLNADYTVSAILLDSNGLLVAQDDSYPFAFQRPTTSWQPGEVIYDPHVLSLAEGLDILPPGTYTAGVKVYRWSPDGITVMPAADGAEYRVIGTVER